MISSYKNQIGIILLKSTMLTCNLLKHLDRYYNYEANLKYN